MLLRQFPQAQRHKKTSVVPVSFDGQINQLSRRDHKFSTLDANSKTCELEIDEKECNKTVLHPIKDTNSLSVCRLSFAAS